jgi:hypothetical protein
LTERRPRQLPPESSTLALQARRTRHRTRQPLIALTGTSECLTDRACAYSVRRNHRGLAARAASLRGLHPVGQAAPTSRDSHPLMPLASRSEFDRERFCSTGPVTRGWWDQGCAPSHGIHPPFDVSGNGQRPTPGFQPRLRSAYRLSQPLDALLRPKPLRPCFVPVTSMGLASTAAFPRR